MREEWYTYLRIMIINIFVGACFFLFGIAYASFAEWMLHRYWMHRPFWIFGWYKFDYPFKAHAIVHHGKFKADETYHLQNRPEETKKADRKTIPMAWWNGPVLIAMASLPFVLWSIFNPSWLLVGCVAGAVACYYGTYEYIHFCMHLPKGRWFENTRLYKWIDEHHRLHHEHMGNNFNVVLPLADFCLRTLITK